MVSRPELTFANVTQTQMNSPHVGFSKKFVTTPKNGSYQANGHPGAFKNVSPSPMKLLFITNIGFDFITTKNAHLRNTFEQQRLWLIDDN